MALLWWSDDATAMDGALIVGGGGPTDYKYYGDCENTASNAAMSRALVYILCDPTEAAAECVR